MEGEEMKSMTAYRCDQLVLDKSYISFEIRSVNNKYFNLNLSLDDSLKLYGPKIEKLVKKKISRASIDFKIKLKPYEENLYELNLKKFRNSYESLCLMKKELGLQGHINMNDIFLYTEKFNQDPGPEPLDINENKLFDFLDGFLEGFNESRDNEGARLHKDLLIKLDSLATDLNTIRSQVPSIKRDTYAKLKDILFEISDNNTASVSDKLSKDFITILNKIDIDEEITRLNSHIKAFKNAMDAKGPKGKKLDFICQELLREANTIGSKSRNDSIAHILINMKTTIEQIREQVQNIE